MDKLIVQTPSTELPVVNICLAFLFGVAIMMLPEAVYAGDTIGDVLCEVVGWFTGTTGKGIATLAIIVVGVGALMGKVSWGMAIIVAIGVAVIFGAPTIVDDLAASNGSGGGCP